MSEFIILAIPFIGTSLGSAMVFFLKKRIAPKFEKLLLGFAAGVMIAASVWSLLIPSIDMGNVVDKGTSFLFHVNRYVAGSETDMYKHGYAELLYVSDRKSTRLNSSH